MKKFSEIKDKDISKRNSLIDIYRILFIIIIFLNHSTTLLQPDENALPYFRYGFLGVEFFFILSGYLMSAKSTKIMTHDYEIGTETVKFVFGKFKTLFPCYFIAWILGIAIDSWYMEPRDIFVHVFQSLPSILQLNMAGYGGYNVLGNTWYISAMILSMSILFPLILRYRKSFHMVIAPIICVFSYGYIFFNVGNLSTINPIEGGFVFTGLLRALAGISLGCICHACEQRLSVMPFKKASSYIIAILDILLFIIAISLLRTGIGFRPDFLFVCLVALGLILAFCKHNALNGKFCDKKNIIGRFSLCIYLSDVLSRMAIIRIMPEASRDQRLLPAFILLLVFSVFVFWVGVLFSYVIKFIFEKIKKLLLY